MVKLGDEVHGGIHGAGVNKSEIASGEVIAPASRSRGKGQDGTDSDSEDDKEFVEHC